MNKRILVIDDEPSLLEAYRLILEPPRVDVEKIMAKEALEMDLFGTTVGPRADRDERFEVTTAQQGEEGYRLVQEMVSNGRPFAVAFVDVRMPPGWDGIVTAKMIREADTDIELVIVTAYSDRDRSEIVAKIGRPDKLIYLRKPFDPQEVKQLALCLTGKWDLEQKTKKHIEYLNSLLGAITRLKTMMVSSLHDILSSILREMLGFLEVRTGLVISNLEGKREVLVSLGDPTPEEIEKAFNSSLDQRIMEKNLMLISDVLVMPLDSEIGQYLMALAVDEHVYREKETFLSLLGGIAAEVLKNFKRQLRVLENERMAVLGQVSVGIIHEINNPLTAMMGVVELHNLQLERLQKFVDSFLELSRYQNLPEEIRDCLQTVGQRYGIQEILAALSRNEKTFRAGADRIKTLLENIRDFFRGKDNYEFARHDVSEALESTLALLDVEIRRGIVVHRGWSGPLKALCDLGALKQVFLNLLLNAIQAMDGPGNIWIGAGQLEENIRITIRDSGKGIPVDIQQRIWEPFYTSKSTGTGLGLSVVQRIVAAHKGRLSMESEVGKGTTFIVEIPR